MLFRNWRQDFTGPFQIPTHHKSLILNQANKQCVPHNTARPDKEQVKTMKPAAYLTSMDKTKTLLTWILCQLDKPYFD